MSAFSRNVAFDSKFHEELGRLRLRIETVPHQHRAKLLVALDSAQEQYEKTRAANRWMVDKFAAST